MENPTLPGYHPYQVLGVHGEPDVTWLPPLPGASCAWRTRWTRPSCTATRGTSAAACAARTAARPNVPRLLTGSKDPGQRDLACSRPMLPPTAPEAYPLAQGYPLSPRAEGRPRRLVRSEAAPCMAWAQKSPIASLRLLTIPGAACRARASAARCAGSPSRRSSGTSSLSREGRRWNASRRRPPIYIY